MVLAGHSLGASLASSVAVDHPELVKALVIVDPAYGFTPASPSFLPEFTTRRVMSIPANVLFKTYVNHADAPERVFREPEAHAFLSRRQCPVLGIHTTMRQADYDRTTYADPRSLSLDRQGSSH